MTNLRYFASFAIGVISLALALSRLISAYDLGLVAILVYALIFIVFQMPYLYFLLTKEPSKKLEVYFALSLLVILINLGIVVMSF